LLFLLSPSYDNFVGGVAGIMTIITNVGNTFGENLMNSSVRYLLTFSWAEDIIGKWL